MQSNYKINPVAQTFKSELEYVLELHFAKTIMIYLLHIPIFMDIKAYNTAELTVTSDFNGLDSSLIGSFRVVIQMSKVEFDF